MDRISRRRFLEMLSLAAGATAIGCGDDEPQGSTRQVVVLGAGLAGMCAAHELVKAGYDVVVLEAQARAGGRVFTSRDGFRNGIYGEMGAVRVPDAHLYTNSYIDEFGLERVLFPSGDPLYYLKGNRFQHTEGGAWPANFMMTAAEEEKGLDMWGDYVAAFFDEFGDPKSANWPPQDLINRYDQMSWGDFLRSKGASDDFLTLYKADNGTEIDVIGALAWMAQEVADQTWSDTFGIKGGNDNLPRKFREALGERIQFESVITRIAHTSSEVVVTYEKNGRSESIAAQHCVVAIPFTILRDIEITPDVSGMKRDVIDNLYMMNASRVNLQTKTRFWTEQGIGGLKVAKTDTGVERIWDPSSVMEGPEGLLMAYMQHQNADALLAISSEAERIRAVRSGIEAFFPELATQYDNAASVVSWRENPWVKGAWTDLRKGEISMLQESKRAEGRLHFAGEHTSIWSGWMNGALESGQRAASEIMQSSGLALSSRRLRTRALRRFTHV